MIAPIEETVHVDVAPQRAFDAFVRAFGQWWPVAYTWSGDALRHIAIEPFDGGRCVEIGPDRFTVDWGRVVAWDPPGHLAFTWQISADRQPIPDPDRSSIVDARFDADGDASTRVTITHRDFSRHDGDATAYRDALAADEGWPFLLQRYQSHIASS